MSKAINDTAEVSGKPISGNRIVCPGKLVSLESLRARFNEFLKEQAIGEADRSNWSLVLSEAVANAIKHGCAGLNEAQIEVVWKVEAGQICLEVKDPGNGPPDALTREPVLPQELTAVSGRGLFLMHSFSDRWEHWRSAEGYRVILWKRHEAIPKPESLSALLDSTLEELSNSYENLSAFYRLGDGLARAETLSEFIRQALDDLDRAVEKEHLSLNFHQPIVEVIGAELAALPSFQTSASLGRIQRRVSTGSAEFTWESQDETQNDEQLGGFACGVCFPVRAGGTALGVITVARRSRRPFKAGELSTVRTIADIVGIAVLNARNTIVRSREARALRELEIAADIQKTLLPLPSIDADSRWELTTRREGAREVAGDYVGAARGENGDLYLVIVDVMGKGVSASFLAGMFRTAFNISLTSQYSPAGLMLALNRTLTALLGDLTMFLTCCVARISAELDALEVVNAGHCPALLARQDGSHATLKASGPPLGIFPEAHYDSESLPLTRGDKLFLVTDGLYEWGTVGTAWNWEGLSVFLQENRSKPGNKIWDLLIEKMDEYHPDSSPMDDRTYLCWELNE